MPLLMFRILCLLAICISLTAFAQPTPPKAHYLGNEALMIEHKHTKILFDPFFHNHFNYYTLVPENIRQAIFSNQKPYHDIDAIFISHAHADHFDANDMLNYLTKYPKVKLVAPAQAIRQVNYLDGSKQIESQLISFDLSKGQKPQTLQLTDSILVEAVRIPHAGWPQRANIENIVFRVMLENQVVVMHMGDADPNKAHYEEHFEFWPLRTTNHAFPPYWFSTSLSGQHILKNILNTQAVTGVHVPAKVPEDLKSSGDDYFSRPGDIRVIKIDPTKTQKAQKSTKQHKHGEHSHQH